MTRQTLFADVLLPLPVDGYFTYRVPQELNDEVMVGQRAVVQFGSRKVYAGLIRRIHEQPPKEFTAKYIVSLLDQHPVVNECQFEFWEWLAHYYCCTYGEVMAAALPPAMKLSGETKMVLNHDAYFDEDHTLTEKEAGILAALENRKELNLSDAATIASLPKVLPVVKGLVEKGLIHLVDSLDDTYTPKIETIVKLSEEYDKDEALKEVFDQAEKKAPRQLEMLINFVSLSKRFDPNPQDVVKKELVASVKGGNSAFAALHKKGVFYTVERTMSRFKHNSEKNKAIVLNQHQEDALKKIKLDFATHDICLLHGVTSSGKTEIYIKLINEYLAKGMQVLYLLPEIALTAQIINRLQNHFGNRAGIYHSRFNAGERMEVWNNLLHGGIESNEKTIKYDLVLGPRSAMFLPFQNLGLIIIDEEHEPSYKQYDPAPRYHARDAAIYLASKHKAKVLMGSATPSLESYFNASRGKYGLTEINHRHGGVMMPEIVVADLKYETRHRKMKSHFSSILYDEMTKALENKEQVILFQNRRGFSPRIECNACNWIPECHQCDVSLIYHKKINKLKCHYCGFSMVPPSNCHSCNSTNLQLKGFGTEKIEEELPLFFPDAKVARMDLDTTRSKNAYHTLISDFEDRKIDILVGTQMVSKGLDFDNVGVVGILNADNMLGFPDFRAAERAFQLMAQVSGRAGRSHKRGKVVIQTWNVENKVVHQVVENNYQAMYLDQMAERQRYLYPPYVRLVIVSVLHRDPDTTNKHAAELAKRLRFDFKKRVLGPEFPVVARIKNQYIKNIMVKLNRDSQLASNKDKITEIIDFFRADLKYKGSRIIIDVDPM